MGIRIRVYPQYSAYGGYGHGNGYGRARRARRYQRALMRAEVQQARFQAAAQYQAALGSVGCAGYGTGLSGRYGYGAAGYGAAYGNGYGASAYVGASPFFGGFPFQQSWTNQVAAPWTMGYSSASYGC